MPQHHAGAGRQWGAYPGLGQERPCRHARGTVNAIGLVVNYLLDNGLCNDAERAYLEALKKLHASTAGTGLGIDCADGPFGPLTIIGGRIFMREGRIVQTMDSRYPTCTNAREDEGADQGGHRHGCFSGEGRGCRAF